MDVDRPDKKDGELKIRGQADAGRKRTDKMDVDNEVRIQ